MKLILKISTIILISLVISLDSYSISNLQIFKICRNKRRQESCIKRLKLNRELIYKGKPIEIPVYPYKSK